MGRMLHWFWHLLGLNFCHAEHRGRHLYVVCTTCGKLCRRLT